MLETLVVLALMIALPLVFVAVLLRLLWWLVLLPFKLLGLVAKALGGLAMAVAAVLGVVLAVVLIPLLPVILFFGLLWLIVRPRPAPRHATMT